MPKETILKTTLNIFAYFGIKGVSMNQIADALGISKNTLYVNFGNKGKLLNECLEYEKKKIFQMMDYVEKQKTDPISAIALLTYNISQYKSSYCLTFYKDIKSFYQANCTLHIIREEVKQKFLCFFKKGAQEGFFHSDGNYEMISSVFMEQIILMSGRESASAPRSHKAIVLLTFLRGISTKKGLSMIEKLLPKEEEKYIYEEL